MKVRGFDGKATVINAPSDNAGKGNAAQRAMQFFEKAPNWLKKTFGTLVKRFPLLGQALIARDSYDILTNENMPWDANPDQPSKGRALMSLLGNVSGMTLGGIAGSFIPLPVLSTLAGAGIGSYFGGDLGVAAYKALWLQHKGVDVMSLDFLRAMFTDTTKGVVGGSLFTTSGEKMISQNEAMFGKIGSAIDYVKSRGGDPKKLAEIEANKIKNVNFVEAQLPATTDKEYLARLGITNPIIIQNDNRVMRGFGQEISSGFQRIVPNGFSLNKATSMVGDNNN